MKDYDKNKKSSYIQYWDVNTLYGWAMSMSIFDEDFISNYNEESVEGHSIS